MIIVSQDKSEIFNFNEIFRLYVDSWSNEEFATESNCFCIRAEKSSDNMMCAFLGEYKTEGRAKEVLQQIACRYSSEEMYKTADQKTKEEMTQIYVESEIVPYTFEMPEE